MLISHYDERTGYKKPLDEHVEDVYSGLCSIDTALSGVGLFDGVIEKISIYRIIAYLHDIGKATSYFQHKILQTNADSANASSLSNHALLGAILSLYCTDKLGFELPFQMLIYRLLHSHHSSTHKPFERLELNSDDLTNLKLQYSDVLNNPESNEILDMISHRIQCKLPRCRNGSEQR